MPQKVKPLDVKQMLEPILRNYDEHVEQFIEKIRDVSCTLLYEDSFDVRTHILDKTTYACSISYSPAGKKPKILKRIFPVMIRSKLDLWIRRNNLRTFDDAPPPSYDEFDPIDIIPGFFLIRGAAKHLPYFFTSDPTNTHVLQKNKIVRCYSYDVDDRGKELSLYIDHFKPYSPGELIVKLNNGSRTSDVEGFFNHCPYPTRQAPHMHNVFDMGRFDIDDLGNKAIISPGHMYVKLFMKYVYMHLRNGEWNKAKVKAAMVVKSIDSGELLHVLSRKTLYDKEVSSGAKMVGSTHENRREVGMKGEVYVEKIMGCYREVTQQTYPLNPYFTYLIIRQISSKVKNNSTMPFPPSYLNFFCMFGMLETKNIGRTNMMARNTYVSTSYDMDSVFRKIPGETLYQMLDLRPDTQSEYYVVINEACIPVTLECFNDIDLLALKEHFTYIECYMDGRFLYIRFKVGIFFKKMGDVWVTPRDERYWADRLYGLMGDVERLKERYEYNGELAKIYALKIELADKFGYDHLSSYLIDLNPYFAHNSFSKVIWAFNSLKNAVLATDKTYSLYFLETISAYTNITPLHEMVCEPVDDFSKRFAMFVPTVTVAYMSVQGKNQEDSIVARKDVRAFDCYRIMGIRLKLKFSKSGASAVFRPVVGEAVDGFLGTIVSPECCVEAQSCIHASVKQRSPQEIDLKFDKCGFTVVDHEMTKDGLVVILEKFHKFSTGDKMGNLFGQKGVASLCVDVPLFNGNVRPHLVINSYCFFRMTLGQPLAAIEMGGQDATVVCNSKGKVIPGAKAFFGPSRYFSIAFWGDEHLYTPTDCVVDKIIGQAVRGRSRKGGMRIGNMELMNCLRGNGIAACFEEKFIKDGDGILKKGAICIPKAVELCVEDAKFFKCNIQVEMEPCVTVKRKYEDSENKKFKFDSDKCKLERQKLENYINVETHTLSVSFDMAAVMGYPLGNIFTLSNIEHQIYTEFQDDEDYDTEMEDDEDYDTEMEDDEGYDTEMEDDDSFTYYYILNCNHAIQSNEDLVEPFITCPRCGVNRLILLVVQREQLTGLEQAEIDQIPTIDLSEIYHKCGICFEYFKETEKIMKLHCNHVYHDVCITPWLLRKTTCPECRTPQR